MIDTIKIKISSFGYQVTNYSMFGTTERAMDSNPLSFFKYKNKLSKKETGDRYYPDVTILKQGFDYNLIVEFSAPTIVFGHSFNELTDEDLGLLLETLSGKLAEMGVCVNPSNLARADVIALHVAKNIVLEKPRAQEIIRDLSRLAKPAGMDASRVRFANGGESLFFHAGTHEFVLYDKESDLKKFKNRSIDRFKPAVNIPPMNILRIEARLLDRVKLNAVMKKIGRNQNPKFKNVFKRESCRLILLSYWRTLIASQGQPITPDSSLKLLGNIIRVMRCKPQKAINYLGLLNLMADNNGVNGLRSLIQERYPGVKWRTIGSHINKLNKSTLCFCPDYMAEVEKQIIECEPVRV